MALLLLPIVSCQRGDDQKLALVLCTRHRTPLDMSDKMNDATCVAPPASVLATSAISRRLSGATAADASSQAEQVMQVFRAAPFDAAAFPPVYTQCVSAAFVVAHPAELVVKNRLLQPAAPRFRLVFACVNAATGGAALPDHLYGHPVLVHGPDTMPTYITTFIKDQCALLPADHAMHSLLDCVDDVAALFAVHGALLAGLHEFVLWDALALAYEDTALRDGFRALAKALLGKPSPAVSSDAEAEPPRVSDTDAVREQLTSVLKVSESPEPDVSDSNDAAPLVGERREPPRPCRWWHFPSRWPSRALSALVRRGYSCCRLMRTSHDVAVFHARDTASGQAMCIKMYGVKPAEMLEAHSALANTEVRGMVMPFIAESFDTCVGYAVVVRWEDGVTIDDITTELRPALTQGVAEVVTRMKEDGCAHGGVHVCAGPPGGEQLRVRLTTVLW